MSSVDKVTSPRVITIDGPAGSGKSTVSNILSQKMGWKYVSTGALYRTMGYLLYKANKSVEDKEAVNSCAKELEKNFKLDLETGDVFLNGVNITKEIRSPEASERTSQTSKDAYLRELLLPIQRDMILSFGGAVVDGRDMGTVVFPNAPLKVYLVASAEKRAERRHRELSAQGIRVNVDEIIKEIHERDQRDSNRTVAPMKPATDAIMIDSSDKSPEEVAELIKKEAAIRSLIN